MNAKTLISAALASVALAAAASAQAYSDAAFDRVGKSYAAASQSKWHNALVPQASGDYVAVAESGEAVLNRLVAGYGRPEAKWMNGMLPEASGDYVAIASADEKFMREVAFYTRDMLDRGGWVNAFIAGDHYAAGHGLLAVRESEGVTSMVPA